MSSERQRLETDPTSWRRWGPYLAERAWGTVREDYSADGSAWTSFPHDHARSRAYRWNEDGLLGISDDLQRLCFSLALWNGRDPILKERLFGLNGPEGNHGEDVKECYWYLDSTPSHSYMQALYRYPQRAFPYEQLVAENGRRGRDAAEFELWDTGIFEGNHFFDVTVEYAKRTARDVLIRITATNHGPDPAALHLLPTLWFRNTWSWRDQTSKPSLRRLDDSGSAAVVEAEHHSLRQYLWLIDSPDDLLFTENESNAERLWDFPNGTPYVKDAFNRCVVEGERGAVNPEYTGTKAAAHFQRTLAPGEAWTVRLRLVRTGEDRETERAAGAFDQFDETFARRQLEADEFYAAIQPETLSEEERRVQRQAFAGMLWSKQFYYFDVERWMDGDPGQPAPPPGRKKGRNREWRHLNCADVISMPDKWEYPWFAAWDLAFHCIPLALVDSGFAKAQLLLLLREWYQHPNGDVPAYEWAFGDSNPPVLAWAALRIYHMDRVQRGEPDTKFLEKAFHKLLLNFTWWVNRKDSEGNSIFEGGFLGLDNIGVFDRSATLPSGGHLEQSDGTSWMAMFSLNMMAVALELATTNSTYEDIATKFFEHFLRIAAAMNAMGEDDVALWDDGDEFFYDMLHLPQGNSVRLRVRTLVGLIPLLAVETIEPGLLERLPGFRGRLEWVLEHRPDLASLVSRWAEPGRGERRLLALVRGHRMKCLLRRALDPAEFLSDFGIRSLSRTHLDQPYVLQLDGARYEVRYDPGESTSGMFGGNSNWRGPIWFPINYLLVDSLREFHRYYAGDFQVECPTGSGQLLSLREVADDLAARLTRLFLPGADGARPFNRAHPYANDPLWRDLVLYHEYFHGDSGAGLGATHQTGWTGLVAALLQLLGEERRLLQPDADVPAAPRLIASLGL